MIDLPITPDKNTPLDGKTANEQAVFSILEDLQAERKALGEQRVAILNILEDVNEAQAKLKRKYQETDIIKELNERLANTLEYHTVMQELSKTLRKFLPDREVAYLAAPQGQKIDTEEARLYMSPNKISDVYCQIMADETLKLVHESSSLKGYWPPLEISPTNQRWRVEEGTVSLAGLAKPQFMDNFSFKVEGAFGGVLVIATSLNLPLSVEEVQTIENILDGASLTVARLKALVAGEHSRIADLVESMSNGVLMFDLNRLPIIINRFVRELLGDKTLSLEQFSKLFSITSGTKTLFQAIDEVVLGKSEHFNEAVYDNRFYEIQVTPVKDYQGKLSGGVVVLYDITRLKEVDKMKTEFVSIASHQLRTPLTAIKLFLELLFDEKGVGPLNEMQKGYMNDLHESAERMIKLVNDLLNVSRLETGRLRILPKPTDLISLIDDVVKEAKIIASGKCEVNMIKPKTVFPLASVDPELIRQVAHNLIMNGVRYTAGLPNPKVEINLKEDKENYILSVKDNGIGVDPADQARIFEKFFRATNAMKQASDGSGLGLYVGRMVMDASGGKIWLESKGVGKGTTAYVSIPKSGMQKKEGEIGLNIG